jgi:hypothetical protein
MPRNGFNLCDVRFGRGVSNRGADVHQIAASGAEADYHGPWVALVCGQ